MPSAIVLVIDGLGAKHLGPYGNTSIDTPAFNRLAVESQLVEYLYTPSDQLRRIYDAYWQSHTGTSADSSELPKRFSQHESGPAHDLLSELAARQISTRLMTDDPLVSDHDIAALFSEQMEMESPVGLKLSHEWDETHAAKFSAAAIELIEQMEEQQLLWLHTAGLGNPWDAPFAYREQFADEDDPEPTGSAQVPSLTLDADYDPDILHELQCGLGGQVLLWDQCLGVLLSVAREVVIRTNCLLIVTGSRGFPLGEHLHVGWNGAGLFHELLHVPAFLRFPDGAAAMQRVSGLAEVKDVMEVLRSWMFGIPKPLARPPRKFSLSHAANQVTLRTGVWQAHCQDLERLAEDTERDATSHMQLYLKPDDLTEVNDVAGRCAAVVEAARQFLCDSFASQSTTTPVALPPILQTPLD